MGREIAKVDTVQPNTEQDIIEAVRRAREANSTIEIVGGRTRRGLGRPVEADQTLSLAKLDGITLYEPGSLTLIVQGGTCVAKIEAALKAENQQLPFEPMDHRGLYGSTGEPTIGGVVACNVSGPRRIQAGACRDSLIGVRFVNGAGESVKSGGRVMKNVTGYDLVKLMCGSYGTLGVLTEVAFKVLPAPERAATLIIDGLDDVAAIGVLTAAMGSPNDVSGAAHVPANLARDGVAATAVRVEGLDGPITHRLASLKALLAKGRDTRVIEGDASAAFWREVRDVAPFHGQPGVVWRLSVKPTAGPVIAQALRRETDARVCYDWSGGLVWALIPESGEAGAADVRAQVAAQGGHATLVRASDEMRRRLDVFQPRGSGLARIDAALKSSFDPAGVFNPGRMTPVRIR